MDRIRELIRDAFAEASPEEIRENLMYIRNNLTKCGLSPQQALQRIMEHCPPHVWIDAVPPTWRREFRQASNISLVDMQGD